MHTDSLIFAFILFTFNVKPARQFGSIVLSFQTLSAMSSLYKELFGKTSDGQEVYLYKLENGNGVSIGILNFGGIIQSIRVPDKSGKFEDITTGFSSVKEYESNPAYFGAIIGRVANRISEGKYEINGKQYRAPLNRDHVCLHGGIQGFDKKCWDHKVTERGLLLQYTSPNGEESFPGNLKVSVLYSLNEDNTFGMDMTAETDEETVINLTNHAYFNLASHKADDIYDHTLTINARSYLPKNKWAVPTGEIAAVDGTPFDFRQERNLGEALHQVVEDSVVGIDHCLCIQNTNELGQEVMVLGAVLKHPESGRVMEIRTNLPGIQIYTGNYLDGLKGKEDALYKQHSSVALEAQLWPDAPNQPHFPSIYLKPSDVYHRQIELKFTVEK